MDNNVIPITQDPVKVAESTPEFIVLKFADSKIPVFKESRNKDYIKYGIDNAYPDYLTYLFNKSAKHGAIVAGKAFYIFGEGYANGDIIVNRLGKTLNDISKKAILDIEIYGGFRLEIIWNAAGKVKEVYHVDYTTIRVGKNGGYYFKECWDINNHDDEVFIPAFNPSNPFGSQIYAYNEYRPKTRYYPLPEYVGSNNFIETDIEISKYYLSAIRNGMTPSKMIQFFTGEPTEDKKREVEHRMEKKFAGAENAGKFLLVFNSANAANPVKVDDLSATDLDKHMIELNKTCQQEIFSGHRVTSPMLFGIKTEGQLGGNTELRAAYELFQSTYSKPKASAFDKEINYLLSYSTQANKYELRPTDPIGIQFDVKDVISSIPLPFIFEKLGIPKELWPATAQPAAPALDSDIPVNENMKNLSGRQMQHVKRVIKQYSKGEITEAAAKAMLRTGLGLTEKDINDILGIKSAAMSAIEDEEAIADIFDEYGDNREDFEIIKSKKVCFGSDIEAEADEEVYIQEAFKTFEVTRTEQEILNLIKKDPKITPEVIADAINQTKKYVQSKLDSLVKRGYLETLTETIGEDEVISRTIPESVELTPPPDLIANPPVQVMVKYSYEVKPGIGPAIIATTRPFCRKMIHLNRLYSRAEIEAISLRLGYSVWDRKGGWWGKKPECRHRWVSNVVVKKK
jgi:DNA-binding MarR family transcriptional regulator